MRIRFVFIALFLFSGMFILNSCNSSKDNGTGSGDISDQNLQGQIEGIGWEFASGSASRFSGDTTFLSIKLYRVQVDSVCDPWPWVDTDRILFFIPAQVGDYQLSLSGENPITVTLYDEEQQLNTIASEGVVSIYEITAEQVSLGLNVTADNVNFVNGKCAIPFCE